MNDSILAINALRHISGRGTASTQGALCKEAFLKRQLRRENPGRRVWPTRRPGWISGEGGSLLEALPFPWIVLKHLVFQSVQIRIQDCFVKECPSLDISAVNWQKLRVFPLQT